MTLILTIANAKGGVGKSTTVFNLGYVLARMGKSVLMVDLDPQASLTIWSGLNPYALERSSYSILMYPEITLVRAIYHVGGSLTLLPGSVDLASASVKLVQGQSSLDHLRTALRTSSLPFDVILIDTAPGLDVLAAAALVAADSVLIPVQCHPKAMYSIRTVMETIGRIRQGTRNPNLHLHGVLATFYDPNSLYAHNILQEMRDLLPGKVFDAVVPYDVHVADAPLSGFPVVEYAPLSPASIAYQTLAKEITRS